MGADSSTTADDIRRHAFGPDRWCDIMVGEQDGRIVAYALYRVFFEGFTGRRRFFLSDLGVASDARRDGIGHEMMAAVARRARELGCDVVTWECSNENHVALSFYDKLGCDRIDRVVYLALSGNKLADLAREAP